MNKLLIVALILTLMISSFLVGLDVGAYQAAHKFIEVGQVILKVELNPIAKEMLTSNPELMTLAIKNYKNFTNPFVLEQAKVNYQKCMIRYGNETSCYNGIIAKYGETAVGLK